MFAAAPSLAPVSAVPLRTLAARASARGGLGAAARIAARPVPGCHRRLAARPQAAAAAATGQDPELIELKMALLDSFWGTERGLSASSDSRAEINELITQVGARVTPFLSRMRPERLPQEWLPLLLATPAMYSHTAV